MTHETLVERVARALFADGRQWDKFPPEYREQTIAAARRAIAAIESTRNDERKLVEALREVKNFLRHGGYVTDSYHALIVSVVDAALADFQPTNGETL